MNKKTFYSFVSPSLITMVVLMIIPLIAAVVLGLHVITYSNLNAPRFVGLENYRQVLTDPDFWASFRFTGLYIIVTVPLQIFLGFLTALVLDQFTNFKGLLIGILLLPMVITPVVSTLMFRTMFDKGGIIYFLLQNIFDYKFIMKTETVRLLIFINAVWGGGAFPMIVFYSGLQTLNSNLLEASTVDGAKFMQKIRYIVLPHLRSLFLFVALMNTMDAYRVFDNVLVLTKQNPLFKADTVMYYNFRVATSFGRLGKAHAMSILTVIGIFIVLIPFLVMTYKQQTESK